MKEAIVAFCVALVIGAAINGWMGAGSNASPSPEEHQQATSPAAADVSSMSETNEGSWDTDVLQAQTPVLVDFYGDNCPPCIQMTPVLAKLASEYQGKVRFVRINVENNPAACARYNVQTMPTFVLFKGGKVADSYTGIVPEEALKQAIDKALG